VVQPLHEFAPVELRQRVSAVDRPPATVHRQQHSVPVPLLASAAFTPSCS
jgi:hypothetical protein